MRRRHGEVDLPHRLLGPRRQSHHLLENPVKQLVINADDYGLTAGVNRAIIDCQRAGIVTSVSQLPGGTPLEGSGVHLRLTDGRPILPANFVPSLVTGDGSFPRHRHQMGKVRPLEVRHEFEAQIREHHLPPSHLDTHCHSHAIPEVFEVYAELCQFYHCAGVALDARQTCILRQMGVRCADFAEIRWTGRGDLAALLREHFERYETVHLMCHPGYVDDELRSRSSLAEAREAETEILLSGAFREFLAREEITLIGMEDLPEVDPLAKVDLLYLASNRREFTVESATTLRQNTDWSRVRSAHFYHDGPSEDGTLEALRGLGLPVMEVKFGSPVAVMNDYLSRGDCASWMAKIDNDTMVPPNWLPECLDVLKAHPFVDLLGIEAINSPGKPPREAVRCSHIGGIGLMRTSAFTELPEPNGRSGFGDWQIKHPEVTRAWIKPALPVFLLDRLPFQPWKSLSARYEEKGWQRPWRRYTLEDQPLWGWWNQ
jgi:predicted glycoside hydrolase/deacetylase ChbG (UPF0249 family)